LHLRINDFAVVHRDYGKAVGVMVLTSVAEYTQSTLREMDYFARLEDGEFIALLPGSTLSEAGQVSRRLQSAAANCTHSLGNKKATLQIAVGLAQLQPNESAIALMARAKDETESQSLAAAQ